jgi:hypothetical protein
VACLGWRRRRRRRRRRRKRRRRRRRSQEREPRRSKEQSIKQSATSLSPHLHPFAELPSRVDFWGTVHLHHCGDRLADAIVVRELAMILRLVLGAHVHQHQPAREAHLVLERLLVLKPLV